MIGGRFVFILEAGRIQDRHPAFKIQPGLILAMTGVEQALPLISRSICSTLTAARSLAMDNEKRLPALTVFAGPNGSGKSTVKAASPHVTRPYINAD